GGRHTPFFPGYRPQFYFRTTDVTGSVTLPEGVEMVMPGDNVQMTIELITPIAMEKELRFAIREGGRTVGAGVVTQILQEGRACGPGASRRPCVPRRQGRLPGPGGPEAAEPGRRAAPAGAWRPEAAAPRGGATAPVHNGTSRPVSPIIKAGPEPGGGRHAPRQDHPRLHAVPGEELPYDEEQAQAPRARGVEEALPALQRAYAPQGDEVSDGLVDQGARVHGGSRRGAEEGHLAGCRSAPERDLRHHRLRHHCGPDHLAHGHHGGLAPEPDHRSLRGLSHGGRGAVVRDPDILGPREQGQEAHRAQSRGGARGLA